MEKKNELNNSKFKKYHEETKKQELKNNMNNNNSGYNVFLETPPVSTRQNSINKKFPEEEFDYTKIENENFMYYDPEEEHNTFINVDDITFNNNNLNSQYLLFYCRTLNFSFILNKVDFESTYNIKEIEKYFSNNLIIKFFKEIKINNSENIEKAELLFNNICVESIDTLMTKVLFYEEVYKKENNVVSLKSVKQFINSMYIISDNKEHKIKSSKLLDIISKNVVGTSSNIGAKNKISKMLNEIGLNKIRLSDGYYFYGLEVKPSREIFKSFDGNNLINYDFNKSYKKLLSEREENINPKNSLVALS